MPAYAELQATSNFSFLRGAAHPEELVAQAKALGLAALALADRNSLAGVVRGHLAAKEAGLRYVVGARLDLGDGASALCFPTDRAAYGRLARLITLGRRRAPKGECAIARAEAWAHGEGQLFALVPPAEAAAEGAFAAELTAWADRFPGRVYCAASYLYRGDDRARLARLEAMAAAARAPLLATNDVHYHIPARRPLQDVLTCIREHCTVDDAGYRLFANAERYVKPPAEMARLFADHPDALARTVEVVERCRFALDELRYEYPDVSEEAAHDPQAELVRLAWAGAAERYPAGIPDKVKRLLEHELALIGQLAYAPYFLTVHDTVRFARSQGILCQGRGSAANSAVCYCLGVTAVDPDRIDLLFERFVSAERNEPPDIDVDFEHERREEVIQYIYGKYGRDRAGLTAVVISYRWRSAIREVAKALGLSADVGGALAGYVWGQSSKGLDLGQVRELGLDPKDARLWLALRLAKELTGFPRHLSQHPGGFVMSRGPLCEVVPIANAAMPDRTMIEWDKDDIDALGILKVDVLGLGMLTCIRKAFHLIERHHGRALTLATVPPEDPAVYDMLCLADSVGVFQVESRAQMTMLPRLKPRSFYDLVIEVAIVRPGPIQGDMVHPYLRRRSGQEPVAYPSDALRAVLAKTYGVPLFQEQAMQIAIVGAGFAPAEADRLRRAMATFRRMGTIHTFREKFIAGMIANGYEEDYAVRCFKQIEGFGDYGFPESHAASFALLVYVSSWLKCHYPAAFAAALLNSQPMGFYAPAQIVRDARDHGVRVLPVDVNASHWDCTLEPAPSHPALRADLPHKGERDWRAADDAAYALRLGLREVKGLGEADAAALAAARAALPEARFADMHELWRRSGLKPATLALLADADAFGSLGLARRKALWAVKGFKDAPLPLFDRAAASGTEPAVDLPVMPLGEEVLNDYAALKLSLKSHPMALLRPAFARAKHVPAAALAEVTPGARVKVAGLVIGRQRPGTASGVIFMTLEDETGVANVIVWPRMFEKNRKTVLRSRLLSVTGEVEREGLVIHVVADRMRDETAQLFDLGELDSLKGFDVRHAHAQPAPGYASPSPATGYATRPLAAGGNFNHDHLKMGFAGGPADQAATGRPSDPGTVARRLFPSRDFH
jgi:error-prone DNA polymerase